MVGALKEPLMGALDAEILMEDLAVSDWMGRQRWACVGAPSEPYLDVDGGILCHEVERVEGDAIPEVLHDDLHVLEPGRDVVQVYRRHVGPRRQADRHLERGARARVPVVSVLSTHSISQQCHLISARSIPSSRSRS